MFTTQSHHRKMTNKRSIGGGQGSDRRSAKQVKGAAKEALGKVVGNVKLESEGRADKAEGKVQMPSVG
jgi:hypothetical protein